MLTAAATYTPRKVRRILLLSAFGLAAIGCSGQVVKYAAGHDYVYGLVDLFDLNGERNVPTAFAMLLLAAAGVIALGIAARARIDRPYWLLLGAGFIWMSADEGFQFHEQLVRPMRRLLGGGTLGLLYFAWVVPAMGVVVASAVGFRKFLLRLPRPTALAFVAAGIVYLSGAVGTELLGGRYFEQHGRDLTYAALTTLEETLEFTGVIVFITALLEYRGSMDGHA